MVNSYTNRLVLSIKVYPTLREPNIILKKPANVMFGAFDYNLFQLAIAQIT